MPPKTTVKKATTKKAATATETVPTKVSVGAGITAGLELWRRTPTGPFYLIDTSPDGRFAVDVETWSKSLSG